MKILPILITIATTAGIFCLWPAAFSEPVSPARRDVPIVLAQASPPSSSPEMQRQALQSELASLEARLLAQVLRQPGAWFLAGSSLGAFHAAFNESLTDGQRLAIGAVGVVLALSCVDSAECRGAVADMVELGTAIGNLKTRIEQLDSEVGRTLYVRNTCHHPIQLAVSFQGTDSEWRNLAWWHFDPGQDFFLASGDERIRTRNNLIYYYAATRGGLKAFWRGEHERRFGAETVGTRRIALETDDGDRYLLELHCDNLVEGVDGEGGADTMQEWVLAPIIAGVWEDVLGDGANRLAAELRSALRAQGYENVTVRRMRRIPLPFYPRGWLVDAETRTPNGQLALYSFVKHESGLELIEGRADVIHGLNSRLPFTLTSDADAAAYVQFFSGSIAGEEGPFTIVDNAAQLPWASTADPDVIVDTQERLQPFSVRKQGDRWRIEASVKYGTHLFRAEYEVTPQGMVTMLEDAPIAGPLPLAREYFDGGMRQVAE